MTTVSNSHFRNTSAWAVSLAMLAMSACIAEPNNDVAYDDADKADAANIVCARRNSPYGTFTSCETATLSLSEEESARILFVVNTFDIDALDVFLRANAAEEIIAFRDENGVIANIETLDGIRFIGHSALTSLLEAASEISLEDFAAWKSGISNQDGGRQFETSASVSGTRCAVRSSIYGSFRSCQDATLELDQNQIARILFLANTQNESELDEYLNARAARGIVAHRLETQDGITTIAELDDVAYVSLAAFDALLEQTDSIDVDAFTRWIAGE